MSWKLIDRRLRLMMWVMLFWPFCLLLAMCGYSVDMDGINRDVRRSWRAEDLKR